MNNRILEETDISFYWKMQTRMDHNWNHMKINFELFQLLYKKECEQQLEL